MSDTAQPRIKYKSYSYHTHLKWLGNRAGMLSSEGKPEFRVASPPEFKGEAGVWTPEDLFVAAVETCTMTTFAAYATKKNLPVTSYTSFAEGTLENVEGIYSFTQIVLKPIIELLSESFRNEAEKTLRDAHRDCFIANSIRAEVIIEPRFVIAGEGNAG